MKKRPTCYRCGQFITDAALDKYYNRVRGSRAKYCSSEHYQATKRENDSALKKTLRQRYGEHFEKM